MKIYLGGQYHRSSTCHHGGKNPHWNDTLFITVPFNSDPTLKVELWDDDMSHDDNIGMGAYNIAQYLSQRMDSTGNSVVYIVPIDLHFKGKSAGRVTIGLQFNQGGMGMGGNPMNQGGNPMNQGGYGTGW